MSEPTTIDISHELGKAEAKRRMQARVGDLGKFIPGGMAEIRSSWPAEDRMAMEITVMGQTAHALLDVEERRVRVTLTLPPMLAMMSGAIAGMVRKAGEQLLLEKQ